ncbi:hypothetical protein PT974_07240 [Cladobotryum mycophilum]|uniref:Hint domain-containing protein n=1 Tax=Cladobotryum mycophilum TaxID=491253 RepID=A0ABR0SNX9_9HYPO
MAKQLPSEYFTTFPGFDIINGNGFVESPYGVLPPTDDPLIRDMFSKTQIDSKADFHGHPVIHMTVNWMQKQHTWILPGSLGGKQAHQTIFPKLIFSASPATIQIQNPDNSRLKNGAFGLLAKCIYNGGYWDELNDGRFNSEISKLNEYFDENASFLFAEYLRFMYGLTPSTSKVDQYKSLLLSKAYRYLKQAQMASGDWSNAEVEMYTHFVKLIACGASLEEISEVYRELTTKEPIVDPSAFMSITGSGWTSYRGWLRIGLFDWDDLGVGNLNWKGDWQLAMVVDLFASQFGYWKQSSGSCFASGTKVVLEDGTLKDIEKIQQGDQVRSRNFGGHKTKDYKKATVVFVSSPKRAGRTLYSYHSAPSIKFSDTHPFVSVESSQLAFVDSDHARSLNPTWQSIPTTNIPREQLEEYSAGKGDEDEILYDLILEPPEQAGDAGPSAIAMTYMVADPNGKSFKVMSEAPIFEWFPYAAKFFQRLMNVLNEDGHPMSSILQLLENKSISFTSVLNEVAADAYLKVPSATQATNKESGFSIAMQLLQAYSVNAASAQDMADVVERIIGLLGRTIHNEIATGWANRVTPQRGIEETPVMTMVLLLHSMHVTGLQEPIDEFKKFKVSVLQGDREIATQTFSASMRGWQTIEMDQGIDIGEASVVHYARHDCVSLAIEIQDTKSETLYHGKGSLREGSVSIIGMGCNPGNGHAILEAKVKRIRKDALEDEALWGESQKVIFALALGECFAKRLGALLN